MLGPTVGVILVFWPPLGLSSCALVPREQPSQGAPATCACAKRLPAVPRACLLYTSDAADDM
eukprot:10473353-Alexandrium_andersonii.AAC.1